MKLKNKYGYYRYRMHVCALDSDCRHWAGWIWRLGIYTPKRVLEIALRPADKFAKMDGKATWISYCRSPEE